MWEFALPKLGSIGSQFVEMGMRWEVRVPTLGNLRLIKMGTDGSKVAEHEF